MADSLFILDPEAFTSRGRVAAEKPAADRPERAKPEPAKPEPAEPLWRHVLGERLRTVRHDRGETLDDIATRAGVSPQYLSEMERGLKEPSSEMIAAVAGALDLTLGDLTLEIAETLTAKSRLSAAQVSLGQSAFVLAA